MLISLNSNRQRLVNVRAIASRDCGEKIVIQIEDVMCKYKTVSVILGVWCEQCPETVNRGTRSKFEVFVVNSLGRIASSIAFNICVLGT